MDSLQLHPDSGLHRAARSKKWIEQDDKVSTLAYVRRPPSPNSRGDEKGLSVGFAETQELSEFIAKTREFLSFYGVIGINAGSVFDAGLEIEVETKVKGNITKMPYEKATPDMTSDQLAEVDQARALEFQRRLADASRVLDEGDYKR